MQNARMLGNYVEYLAEQKGLSASDLSKALGCDQTKVTSFLKGRSYASFSQISSLAKMLGASVSELLAGDMQHYDKTVVDCMNEFQDTKNREMILDLIDNYIDVVDAVSAQ
jgi:transcriptional regulator with XRE-family HTH domain